MFHRPNANRSMRQHALPYISTIAALLLATACRPATPLPAPTPSVARARRDVAPPPPPAPWLAFIGEYGPDSAVTIVLERGGRLWLHSATDEVPITPESDSAFVFTDVRGASRRAFFQ